MASAFFISESNLKSDSIFDDNIDPKYLRSLIDECQDIYILPIIGSALYNRLQTGITYDDLTSDEDALLISYIRPCLKAYIKSEAPYELSYKFTNKNVGKKNSEFSTPSDSNELKDIMQHYKNRAEYFGQKLKNFLCENSATYPLYLNYGNGIDSVAPVGRVFDSGMNLDDSNDCGYYRGGKWYKSWRD